MQFTKRCAVLISVFAFYCGSAFCQTPPRPAPSTAVADKWRVTTTKDELNDHPIVSATLKAENSIEGFLAAGVPTLVVRCQTPLQQEKLPPMLTIQPGLDVYVVVGMAADVENGEGRHTTFVRFDDAPAAQYLAGESTDHKALMFAPYSATQMVVTQRQLVNSKRMIVRFTPFHASPATITFDVRGFASHVDTVLAACPKLATFDPSTAGSLIGKTTADVKAQIGEPFTISPTRYGYQTKAGAKFYLELGSNRIWDVSDPKLPLSDLVAAPPLQPVISTPMAPSAAQRAAATPRPAGPASDLVGKSTSQLRTILGPPVTMNATSYGYDTKAGDRIIFGLNREGIVTEVSNREFPIADIVGASR